MRQTALGYVHMALNAERVRIQVHPVKAETPTGVVRTLAKIGDERSRASEWKQVPNLSQLIEILK